MNNGTKLYSFTTDVMVNVDEYDAYPGYAVDRCIDNLRTSIGKYILCKKELYRVDNISYLGLSEGYRLREGYELRDEVYHKLNFKVYCVLVPYNLNDSLIMEPNMFPHSQYLQGL